MQMLRVLAAVLLLLALVRADTHRYPSAFRARSLSTLRHVREPVHEGTFDKLDANNNGTVSWRELGNVAERQQPLPLEGPTESARLTRAQATAANSEDEAENLGPEQAAGAVDGKYHGFDASKTLEPFGAEKDAGEAERESTGNQDVQDDLAVPSRREGSGRMQSQDAGVSSQVTHDPPVPMHVQDAEDDAPLLEPTAAKETSGCQWCTDNDAQCEQLWCSNNCRDQCEGIKVQNVFGSAAEPRAHATHADAIEEEGGLVSGCQWCSENDKACAQVWCTKNCPQQCDVPAGAQQPRQLAAEVAPRSLLLVKQFRTWLATPDAKLAARALHKRLATW